MNKSNVFHEMKRHIYMFLLLMHPRNFREEFSAEMEMDFADAMRDERAVAFYWDGVVSLARQWMVRGLGVEAETPAVVGGPCLLLGQYGMIDSDRLTAFELLRGMIVSVALIAALVMVPMRTPRSMREPANPLGARGTVSAGTGEMQRGGDSDDAGRKVKATATLNAMVSRRATAMEVGASPEAVAATTAAVMSEGPNGLHWVTIPVAKAKFAAFDVVSVRENRNGGESHANFPLGLSDYGYIKTGGVFRASNYSLAAYIAFAYKLNNYQNTMIRKQVPEWALSTRYDIEARTEGGEPTKEEMRTMMRALLAQRFNLKVHTEQREMPVMDLEMVKPDKPGPALVAHASDDPMCLQNKHKDFLSPCGEIAITPRPVTRMAGRNISMENFADFFAGSVIGASGRQVIDKTGLTGTWDFTLDFGPDAARQPDAKSEETGPTFTEGLREQMGLKLVPDKALVQTYMLDGVERPTGN